MNNKPITDITIRIEVDSDTYNDYEKCLEARVFWKVMLCYFIDRM